MLNAGWRRGSWLGAALTLVAASALVVAGCGGSGGSSTAAAPETAAKTTSAKPTGEPQPATAATACREQLGGFLDSMAQLRGTLVAGLDYQGYVDEVKAIEGTYETIPVDSLSLECLRAAGTPGEKALNRYIAAANVWTECVEAPSCQSASIETDLQAKWREASKSLSKARRGLRQLESG